MFRSILKSAISSSKAHLLIPTTTTAAHFSSKKASKSKSTVSKNQLKQKTKKTSKKKSAQSAATQNEESIVDDFKDMGIDLDEDSRTRHLAEEINDKSLDVGPNGRPLFIDTRPISQLGRKHTCFYLEYSLDDLNAVLPEGLPDGMTKEFDEVKRNGLLVRQSFLDLRDNFRRIVDPPLKTSDGKGPKVKKQIVLDGPVSCGKSIALAMLVQWAREEGWLVFYVPKGKSWTHGGFFYHNPQTELWDTPVQAAEILKDFLKYNESRLQQLPCQIFDPIPLGEGAGAGWMRGVDSMVMPEGSTLYDLIQTGITHTHAAVGVVVRLRKELSHVKDIPVLFAIDQYNSWFTFSDFGEPITVRSTRPIHAKEIATIDFPRYSLDEAAVVCHYYVRQRLIRREAFSDEKWKKIYYLSNGNGTEMRWLAPFIR
ncbi:hypothetical protein IFM89_024265 [Coptis chinensis]|uniref:Small ribosomal subunit protein mS29 n=1 Tax=Coptis chinensis TaxID=261450 RepID=A0A835H7R7_9MAGN|nr:hypothetical protein IFM89_024265 [Coptis chinensis]